MNPDTPFGSVSTVTDHIVDGDDVHGFLPVINPLYVDALLAAKTRIMTAVIASSSAYERISDARIGVFVDLVDAPSITLLASERVPEYGLGFVDNTVLIGVFNEHIPTYALVVPGFADAGMSTWEWAIDRYDAVEATTNVFEVYAVSIDV